MLVMQAVVAVEKFLDTESPKTVADGVFASVLGAKENIVLTGMPGSGKSSVGKLVSDKLSRTFIDTDDVINERFGFPGDIIKEKGEDFFRKLETEILGEFCREKGLVISTGGGVVEREENYELIRQNGRVYLIERELSLLDKTGRPLSTDISALYERRKDKYEAFSDVRIQNNKTPEESAEEIIADFNM